MAKDECVLKPAFRAHCLKCQQGAEGLACTRTGMDQHITCCCCLARFQPSAQQLNELLLPLPGANGLDLISGTKSEGRCVDGGCER